MLWLKSESLENFLKYSLFFLVVLICALYGLLAWKFHLAWYWIAVSEIPVFLSGLWFATLIRQRVLRTFTRACLYAEAIAKGEFEQFTKAPFDEGKVKELYGHLALLSDSVQKNTASTQTQAIFELFNFLPTPVLLLNETADILYANKALYTYAQCQITDDDATILTQLNLDNIDKRWRLTSDNSRLKMLSASIENKELGSSEFLIFIDISLALNESQRQARAQLMECIQGLAVNTLTPVMSITEHMKEIAQTHIDVAVEDTVYKPIFSNILQGCNAIGTSCETFNRGILRYVGFIQSTIINQRWVSVSELLAPYQAKYPDLSIELTGHLEKLWCDVESLQVIIFDLIQNAYEAQAQKVTIALTKHEQYAVLEVIDDGEGFSCVEQAVAPFFTTKMSSNAEGLSLYFAKLHIEQHAGVFECQNNTGKGATVMMLLPFVNNIAE